MKNLVLILLFLMGILGPGYAAPEIASIKALENRLEVQVQGAAAGELVLVELPSFAEYDPGMIRKPVWRGTVQAGTIAIPRLDGSRDRLYWKFQLVDGPSGKPLGTPHYVNDLSGIPRRDFDFLHPASIKGLAVDPWMVNDGIALGVKHSLVHINLDQVIAKPGAAVRETWVVDGITVPIDMDYIKMVDYSCQRLTEAGMNLIAILNNYVPSSPDPQNHWINPKTQLDKTLYHLGAFNTTDEQGLLWYRAAIEYVAHRYSEPKAPHGWISGYIIGNEVQSHWMWYNMGDIAMGDFIKDYGRGVRIADLACRRFHDQIRVYVCMDHHWTTTAMPDQPLSCFTGRDFLEQFNQWGKSGGDFPWQVAFHPYPENLGHPNFWCDQRATLSFDTPKITFKNMEVLPTFLKQDYMCFQGQPRRITLNEQGFNYFSDDPAAEEVQAAGYAASYIRLHHIAGIDSYILHRHRDNAAVGTGDDFKLGIWTSHLNNSGNDGNADQKRHLYDVFRLADTEHWAEAFEFAKPVIGIKSWDEMLPVSENAIEKTPDRTPRLTLVEGQKSAYAIVLPRNPSPVLHQAAQALQGTLEQMSGACLPIVNDGKPWPGPALLLGPSDRARPLIDPVALASLGVDGVILKTAGSDVLLLDRDASGPINSVTCFLRRYLRVIHVSDSVRWIPKAPTVTLPLINETYAPPIAVREITGPFPQDAPWDQLSPSGAQRAGSPSEIRKIGPGLKPIELATRIKAEAQAGTRALSVAVGDEGCPSGEPVELSAYMAQQLLWDPHRDPATIRVEFYQAYYGPLADDMLDYMALLARYPQAVQALMLGAERDISPTLDPSFVREGLEILELARTKATMKEMGQRIDCLLFPLWYVRVSDPKRYALEERDIPALLGEMKRIERENRDWGVRNLGKSAAAWLARMEANHRELKTSGVFDLYLHMGETQITNSAQWGWRPEFIHWEGRKLNTIFHHPPNQGSSNAVFQLDLPAIHAGQRLFFHFATFLSARSWDGVRFSVLVGSRVVWTTTQRDMIPVETAVDLSAWAGQSCALTLRMDALENTIGDCAHWISPQIRLDE